MPLIAVNGIKLYYEYHGPALLIPGSWLVLIDGGHLAPLLTRHEQLVAEVSAFLTESA